MRITIASGKGGTGKTTLAVNLAYSLAAVGETVSLLDCDVEAPNAHLFLRPDFSETAPVTVPKPVLDPGRCTLCGRCVAACAFNAMAMMKKKLLIFPELCHACGVCFEVCPEAAIREQPFPIGTVRRGSTAAAFPEAPIEFLDGTLTVGETQAPAVIRAVKRYGTGGGEVSGRGSPVVSAGPGNPERDAARRGPIVIIDASPGTACPVVEAIRGSDVAVLVTEPTPFGLHDLKLAVALSLELGIPTGVVINRSSGRDDLIEEYCREAAVPVLGRVPYRREYAELCSSGDLVARQDPQLRELLLGILDRAAGLAGTEIPPAPKPEDWTISPPGLFDSVSGAGSPPGARFREVGVVSGKGGTGKTTVTAALAVLTGNKVLADTDVDAADLHLVLRPLTVEAAPFSGGRAFRIDPNRCTGCGLCAPKCRFEAIHSPDPPGSAWFIDPVACEACGLCGLVCPADAVVAEEAVTGMTFVSETPFGPMVHARLGVGEENSGKLVTAVRRRAGELADRRGAPLLLADGPPGVGCPVISAITDLDRVLVVTEPTVSGVHDLQRVLDLAGHFGVPARVVINKADLNPHLAKRIEKVAAEHGALVIGSIPFDENVFEALTLGKTVVEFGEGPAEAALRKLCASVFDDLSPA